MATSTTCSICGEPNAAGSTARSDRCGLCRNVHIERAKSQPGATVHPTHPYRRDPAARAFVDAHPDGATLDEVGTALGITRERLRQIETNALATLRKRTKFAGIDPADLAAVLAQRDAGIAPRPRSPMPSASKRPTPVDEPTSLAPQSAEALRITELLDELDARLERLRSHDLEAVGRAVRGMLAELPLSKENAA
jgi:hypothetical protein